MNKAIQYIGSTNLGFALRGFFVGLTLLFATWLIDLYHANLSLGLDSLKLIYSTNPILYVISLFPLGIGLWGLIVGQKIQSREKQLNEEINSQNEKLGQLAAMAESIGNGELDEDFSEIDSSDGLSKALLNMRDKLKINREKDLYENFINEGRFKITEIIRDNNKLEDLTFLVLKELIGYLNIIQGAIYLSEQRDEDTVLKMYASYAYNRKKYLDAEFKLGEGLVGEACIEQQFVHRTEIPDDYLSITSGLLGEKKPSALLIVPLISEEQLQGAIELAGIERFTDKEIDLVQELANIIARTIYNLRINERTARLLKESQKMTAELQEQQYQLEKNAIEMEEKSKEIENANKKQHALLERSSEIITIYDDEGKISFESPSIESILGYTPEEMVGKNDFSNTDAESQKKLERMFMQLLNQPNRTQTIEYSYKKKNGEVIWMEGQGRNLLDDPAINGIVLNSRDITERRKAEKEQIMRGKMQALSENSPDVIIRFDLAGNFLYVNPTLENLIGIKKKDIENESFYDADFNFPESLVSSWDSIIKEVQEQKTKLSTEIEFPTEKGDLIMQVNAIPEWNEKSELDTVLVVSHDITTRKQQERIIEQTNKKITDSINYAKRIQDSIIPDNQLIKSDLPDSFMYYLPKDVVSGDFPWYYKKDDYIYIAAVDCTGHGVPGAMMSLIGYLLMNDITNNPGYITAADLLTQLHKRVVYTLKQEGDNKAADGMDIAICRIHKPTNSVQFSGAHRPLYHYKNGEVIQYKGDKYPIGGAHYKGENKFTNADFTYNKNESIYFFSDGLPDQFGGPQGKKFGPKRIRQLIENHGDKPISEVHEIFSTEFDSWKGNQKQMDDVLLIGIKF